MGLVKETISFQRNPSEEGIRTSLFGFRVGQIIVQKGISPRRPMDSVFVIEYIANDTQLPEITLTIMGLGYIYNLNYRGPNDSPEEWFEFSGGLSTSTGDPKDFRALTEEEMDIIKAAIKKDPEKYKDKQRWFDIRTGELGKKILLKEDFKRGLSSSEIKDKIVGFRPGELITFSEEWKPSKPYKEVYMFIENSTEKFHDGIPIIVSYIGALSRRDGKLSQFLARNKKVLGTTPLWAEGKRGLTKEEMEKVKKTFSELPGYRDKIIKETGLVPSLNEAMEFKRGASSEREVKEKLLGWRPGQLLVINDNSKAIKDVGVKSFRRILVFGGITEKPLLGDKEWVIRTLEIGHISGDSDHKIAYIHFGFTEDIMIKRKIDLKIPNEDEIAAIQKALKNPDYQKYVLKAEEKIGVKLFV
jgi:hypothetical protein